MLLINTQELITNTRKNYDKNKESLYRKYWDVYNLYRWAMSQKLTVDSFTWVEQTSQFNKDYTENYNEGKDPRCFLEADVPYPEKSHELHNDLLTFLPERMKIEKVEKLVANLHNKNMFFAEEISMGN